MDELYKAYEFGFRYANMSVLHFQNGIEHSLCSDETLRKHELRVEVPRLQIYKKISRLFPTGMPRDTSY